VPSSVLIRNATILTMNDDMAVIYDGSVSIRAGRIEAVGEVHDIRHDIVIDAAGDYLLPGFIQTHIHLCQTLFRGYADDLRLMPWLQTRIWPMEAAHTATSLRAAARLASLELLLSGTTAVLTMETTHETDAVFEAVAETGIRATVAKCMIDSAKDVPDRLLEDTRSSIDESLALYRRWNGAAGGRIRAAFAPRFALTCSRELLEEVATLSRNETALVHTHAAEQQEEIDLVRQQTGQSNIGYLADIGIVSSRLCAAHCVWVSQAEQETLANYDAKVLHCPGSNLKLGSGIAPVTDMIERGICVSLGSDGAACNNHLDMFGEMRLAATLQAVRSGPGALPASRALWMATRNGARTIGLEHEIGSVEVGKRADLVLIASTPPHLVSAPDPFSALVYSARPDDVQLTMVDGDILVREGQPVYLDDAEIRHSAREEARRLAGRAAF